MIARNLGVGLGVAGSGYGRGMVDPEVLKRLARTLPRSEEAVVHDRVKFRVRGIVYLSFSRDETTIGFGYPREEREALLLSDPEKFLPPLGADYRFQWVRADLSRLGEEEAEELIVAAWEMTVPKKVIAAYRAGLPAD
jgi:hypothetical protein